jgi:thioesterase domain-containing protein
MDKTELQHYLHKNIPPSKSIGVTVCSVSAEGITLAAPLGPNVNHQGTVFAGSASSVALLSAWALLFTHLRNAGINACGVVQKNSMTYERPITADFTAFAPSPDAESWQKFLKMLKTKKKARISLEALILCNSAQVGKMEGDFVAILD